MEYKKVPKKIKPTLGDIAFTKGKIIELKAIIELENGEKIISIIPYYILEKQPNIGDKVVIESNFCSCLSEIREISK